MRQRTFARVGQMTINRWFQNSHFHLDWKLRQKEQFGHTILLLTTSEENFYGYLGRKLISWYISREQRNFADFFITFKDFRMKYIFTLLAVFYTYVLAGESILLLCTFKSIYCRLYSKLCMFVCTESISIFLVDIVYIKKDQKLFLWFFNMFLIWVSSYVKQNATTIICASYRFKHN